jgi:phosphoribosylanthranilate isomerase
MMRTRVKVCCILDAAEAALAIAAGADALGLVGPMPSGPGVVGIEGAARIARRVPPGVASFLLTASTRAEDLMRDVTAVQPDVVQIVDAPEAEAYAALRSAFPALKLVQVIHVEDEAAIQAALDVQDRVDAILLDSGRPKAAIRELGGTGRAHDWATSRRLVEAVRIPVWLAGGLGPANVADSIRTVGPFGLDLCSGVRTDGRLDETKLAAFMAAVRAAS